MRQALLGRHVWSAAASLLVLVVLAVSLWMMPRHVFWHPDEGGKFFELASIQWDGGMRYAVPYVGRALDPGLKFFPRGPNGGGDTSPYPAITAQGAVRFHWPIWFPLVSRFMLAAFGITGIYLLPLLSGWLIAVTSGWIAYTLAPGLAPLTVLLVGLGTPVWFYSLTFWEHTLAAWAGLLALALLVTARAGSPRALLVMLGPLFVAVLLRVEMAAFGLAAVVVWALAWRAAHRRPAVSADTASGAIAGPTRSLRQWLMTALVFGLVSVLLYVFASTLTPRHAAFLTSGPEKIQESLQKLPALPRSAVSVVIDTGRDEAPPIRRTWVVAASLAVGLCVLAPFATPAWLEACLVVPGLLGLLTFGALLVRLDLPYRSLHGFLPVAPFTVLWLYALPHAWRGDRRLRTLVTFALLYLALGYALLFISHVDPAGELSTGLEWGQRYLLALYPVLAILAVAALDRHRRSTRPAWLRNTVMTLAACLMVVAVRLEVRGVNMLRANREILAAWDRSLQSAEPILTDVWWLPTAMAPLFVAKQTYLVGERREVAEWAALAAAHGVDAFTFASLEPVRDEELGLRGLRRVPERSGTVLGLHLVRFEPDKEGDSP